MKRTHASTPRYFDSGTRTGTSYYNTPTGGPRTRAEAAPVSPWAKPNPTEGKPHDALYELRDKYGKIVCRFLKSETGRRFRKTEALALDGAIRLLEYDAGVPCVMLTNQSRVWRGE